MSSSVIGSISTSGVDTADPMMYPKMHPVKAPIAPYRNCAPDFSSTLKSFLGE